MQPCSCVAKLVWRLVSDSTLVVVCSQRFDEARPRQGLKPSEGVGSVRKAKEGLGQGAEGARGRGRMGVREGGRGSWDVAHVRVAQCGYGVGRNGGRRRAAPS